MPYKNKRLQAILKITFNDLMTVLGLILAKCHFPQHANLSIGLIRKKHRRIVKQAQYFVSSAELSHKNIILAKN